jgi:hypothetical protein
MLKFLPVGFMGLMVGGLIAANSSTILTHLNRGASYLVHDCYRRFINPSAGEKHYVRLFCRPVRTPYLACREQRGPADGRRQRTCAALGFAGRPEAAAISGAGARPHGARASASEQSLVDLLESL